MLQRMLELPDGDARALRPAALRVIAASGSALPGELAIRVDGPLRRRPLQPLRLDRGRVGDDRHARGPARRARHRRPAAARHDREALRRERPATSRRARPGASSSATRWLFEGYTGGGGKDVIDGLMSTGDVGHFDEDGRLFVDGRDDEMIVSGGENVFPREVEDLLADHEAIDEAAVIGVDDEEFGQRLKAFVVAAPTAGRPTRTTSRRTSRRTSRATRCRARSCSSTSCRATRPARSSSASWPTDGDGRRHAAGDSWRAT